VHFTPNQYLSLHSEGQPPENIFRAHSIETLNYIPELSFKGGSLKVIYILIKKLNIAPKR